MSDWHEAGYARARELALANCTPAEIAAKLKRFLGISREEARDFVESIAEDIVDMSEEGRASMRERGYLMAKGQLDCTKAQLAAWRAWAFQHLGYTGEGFDLTARKNFERAHRSAAKGQVPRLKVAK